MPLPPEVAGRWDTAWNGSPAPASGKDSKQQAYFWLRCGQCRTKIQIKTACKQPDLAFACRLHGSSGKGISAHQLAAVELVQQLAGTHNSTVEQYRVLALAQKAVDIVVEPFGLLMEVDGAQHATDSTGFGEEQGEQCRRDKRFDHAVLSGGGRLLRLHHQDKPSWGRHILAALQKCQQEPGSNFVYYSASYPTSRRVQ